MCNGFQVFVFVFVFFNTQALIARKPLFMKNSIENIEAIDEIYSIYQFSSHVSKRKSLKTNYLVITEWK